MAGVAYPMVNPWGGSCPGRPDARVYRRRRAVALVMVAVAVLATAGAARLALAGPGGGALTSSGSAGVAEPAPSGVGRVYVVQPGDTLWSIVRATGGSRDPRPEVDQLFGQLDGRPLQIGQRILLP